MRRIPRPTGLAAFGVVAAVVLMSSAASAQSDPNATSPWGPRAFCTHGGNWANSGGPNCVYYTWEQCLATASGTGLHCMANPYYVPPGAPARSRHRRG
jgi:hypothetical protein